jgi:hypothetical protein
MTNSEGASKGRRRRYGIPAESESAGRVLPGDSSVQGDQKHCLAYQTKLGQMFLGDAEEILKSESIARFKGKVQLIFTSPPFPLNRKKKYGNLQGNEYVEWLVGFAPLFQKLLV